VLGESPLGGDEAAILEPAERRIERTFLDAEDVVGRLLDPARDGVAVRGRDEEGFEDEDTERALQEVAGIALRGHGASLGEGMGTVRPRRSLVKAMESGRFAPRSLRILSLLQIIGPCLRDSI